MSKKLTLKNIQAMDYLCVTSCGAFDVAERITLAGWLNAFNLKIATHTAIVILYNGAYFIVEMTADGISAPTPITEYTNPKFYWDDRIVQIKRNPIYDNEEIRNVANNRALDDACKSKYLYNYAGLLEFLFPEFKDDNPNRKYCSELVQMYAIKDGNKISMDHKDPGVQGDEITPWDIQKANNLVDVEMYE